MSRGTCADHNNTDRSSRALLQQISELLEIFKLLFADLEPEGTTLTYTRGQPLRSDRTVKALEDILDMHPFKILKFPSQKCCQGHCIDIHTILEFQTLCEVICKRMCDTCAPSALSSQ